MYLNGGILVGGTWDIVVGQDRVGPVGVELLSTRDAMTISLSLHIAAHARTITLLSLS